MKISKAELIKRAKKVKLLVMDCDGVLTDGKLYFSVSGEELKVFNVKDGQGIVMWHNASYKSAIISGRSSPIVNKRAEELGINYVAQNSNDKVKALMEILENEKVLTEEVAFIGDDIGDAELLKLVGFPAIVGDAVSEILQFSIYKTKANGGYGAVRELIELLIYLKN